MVMLVIIADDFTGALDTGVQFSKQGVKTLVTTDIGVDFSLIDPDIKVLSVDIESRHIDREQAYERVSRVSRAALDHGVRCVYKKTDSTLRGNIGCELAALLEESEEDALMFVPAFPKNHRTTVGGVQYVEGRPIAETGFARDPIDPVLFSRVDEIIASQSAVPTLSVPVEECESAAACRYREETVVIFDARTDADLQRIGDALLKEGRLKAVAGCAGFAEMLPSLLGLKGEPLPPRRCAGRVLVAAGSVNQVSLDQLAAARAYGYSAITLTPEQKLSRGVDGETGRLDAARVISRGLDRHGKMMVQAIESRADMELAQLFASKQGIPSDEIPLNVARSMGEVVKQVLDETDVKNLVVFGGDTLLAIMEAVGGRGIMPRNEITPGVVVSDVICDGYDLCVVTKAGGFGGTGVVETIDKYLNG